MIKYFFNKYSKNTGGFRRYVAREILIASILGFIGSCIYWKAYREPYFKRVIALDKELLKQHIDKYGHQGFGLTDEEREKLK